MSKANKMDDNRKHSYTVDIIRAISAILIVLYHYTYRYNENKYIIELGVTTDWKFTVSWGYGAVCTFFMLSGYLLAKHFENFNTRPLAFLIKRLGRLYPTFWVCMTISALVLLILFPEIRLTLFEYIVNLTMLPSLFDVRYIDGAYWTMAYEIMFAILFFGILLVRNISVRKLILIFLLSLSLFEWYEGHSDAIIFKILRVFFIVDRIQIFLTGICIYYILRSRKNCYYYILLVICCIIQLLQGKSAVFNVFYFGTIIVLIASSYFDSIIKDSKTYKIFEFIALISYPLYLLHQMMGFAIIKTFYQMNLRSEIWIIIPIICSLIIAYIVHKYVEVPTAKQDFSKWPRILSRNK